MYIDINLYIESLAFELKIHTCFEISIFRMEKQSDFFLCVLIFISVCDFLLISLNLRVSGVTLFVHYGATSIGAS